MVSQFEPTVKMKPFYELEEFRAKLWDRFITFHFPGVEGEKDILFNQFWYGFLVMHIASEETPVELIYEEVCEAIESNLALKEYLPRNYFAKADPCGEKA